MKISILMSVFLILVLGFGGACNAEGGRGVPDTEYAAKEPVKKEENSNLTTFAAWDEMTTEQQGKLLKDSARKIYYHLEKNDPAKAQCMDDRFLGELDDPEPTEGVINFEKKIIGVPDDKRADNYVENLMAGYIMHDLCGDVTSKNTTETK